MTTLQLTLPINNMKTQILEGIALLKDFHAVVRSPQSNILLVIAIQNPPVVFGYIFFSFNADQKSLESEKKLQGHLFTKTDCVFFSGNKRSFPLFTVVW